MSLRANGSYIGPRPAGPSSSAASGIWDLRTAERQMRASAWPQFFPDPFFSSVSLLLHMDGSNGSTTFTDSSQAGRTITAVGTAAISDSVKKFGSGSCSLNSGGTGYLTVPSSVDFNYSGDFVVEAWIYLTGGSGLRMICARPNGGLGFNVNSNGYLAADHADVVALLASTTTVPTNQWVHAAVVRSGTTLSIYQDGTRVATATNTTSFSSSDTMRIGYNTSTFPFQFPGYIDDMRITNGSDRGYTGSTITVPTAAFPDQ